MGQSESGGDAGLDSPDGGSLDHPKFPPERRILTKFTIPYYSSLRVWAPKPRWSGPRPTSEDEFLCKIPDIPAMKAGMSPLSRMGKKEINTPGFSLYCEAAPRPFGYLNPVNNR
jgi:hypothetical protein